MAKYLSIFQSRLLINVFNPIFCSHSIKFEIIRGMSSTSVPVANLTVKYKQLFINNEWVDSDGGQTFPVSNPATEEVICSVQEASSVDVDRAVEAAMNAFSKNSKYRQMNASYRCKLLRTLANLVERDFSIISTLETLDSGKPFWSACSDVEAAVDSLHYYAGYADKIHGKTIPADGKLLAMTLSEPIGVVGAIIPWNYPFYIALSKIAAPIAAGCTVVLKPSEETPLTALYLASLVKEAGFPPGVLNVVPGFGQTAGASLASHMHVDQISFTGSLAVGREIQIASAKSNMKRVCLELGGKSPVIVCESADVESAALISQNGCFVNMGQCCNALTRTFVHESIYDKFVEISKTIAIHNREYVDDPFKDMSQHGPLINKRQLERALGYVKKGVDAGAILQCGGKRVFELGHFMEPTVFSEVTDDMPIAKDEIFAPVQCIFKFKTVAEAIERANSTPYGLAAGVFSQNMEEALYVASHLSAGQVYVNDLQNADIRLPFGGFKHSGFGREGNYEGLMEYIQVKGVTIKTTTKIV